MKDVPTELPRLFIGAMPERVDPRDVIVSGAGYNLVTLPEGARLGTSSLRRRSQVRHCVPISRSSTCGETRHRMRKARPARSMPVILAAAGYHAHGLERPHHALHPRNR